MEKINYEFNGINFQTGITHNKNDLKGIEEKQKTVYGKMDKANLLFSQNNEKGIIATFKNGNAFIDGGINIVDSNGDIHNYMAYPVYMNDDKIYDSEHGYDGTSVYEYLHMLSKNNPKLRIDLTMTMGTPWDKKIEYWLNKYAKRR